MIIIYGINKITPRVVAELGDEEIIYTTTNGGEVFKETTSLSAEQLVKIDFTQVSKLIICSMYVSTITETLLSIGFPSEKIYAYNCNTCVVEKVSIDTNQGPNNSNTLYAIFDLKTNLASYDMVNFFYLAEVERAKQKLSYIQYIVVPENSNIGLSISNGHHKKQDSLRRIEHIFQPLAQCTPYSIGTIILSYREQLDDLLSDSASVFPLGYSLKSPIPQLTYQDLKASLWPLPYVFDANDYYKKIVDEALGPILMGRKAIVITLREYAAQPQRNSNLREISTFVEQLDQKHYFPIIVRDSYKASTAIDGCLKGVYCYEPAALNTALRIALYQKAYLNFSVNTGPSYLFYFVKNCASVEFRWINNSVFTMTEDVMAFTGFSKDTQPVFANKEQHHVNWQKDSCHAMLAALQRFETGREVHLDR